MTELLTGPLRAEDREAEAAVRLFVSMLSTVVPVDLAVAERAAGIRTEHRFRTPDVLICAPSAGRCRGRRQRRAVERMGSLIPYVHIDDVVATAGRGGSASPAG